MKPEDSPVVPELPYMLPIDEYFASLLLRKETPFKTPFPNLFPIAQPTVISGTGVLLV